MKNYRQTRIKYNLEVRSTIIKAVRSFFDDLNFLEIETPIRVPIVIPELNVCTQESDGWFLNTSPELYMKRLLAAGYDKIFQICKCFRKNERGSYHLPEMTMLEWYEVYSDYKDMMVRSENLLRYVAAKLNYKDNLYYQGSEVDISESWSRITVAEAFKNYSSINVRKALELNVFDEIMCSKIAPNLGKDKPIFLYDYPEQLTSLARVNFDNPCVVERFELYCAGIEICNAYTELTNSTEQKQRFELEIEHCFKVYGIVSPIPELFLKAINNIPLVSGNAMGIDRIVMFFINAKNIDEVTAFVPEEL